jgi:hypothetical protein
LEVCDAGARERRSLDEGSVNEMHQAGESPANAVNVQPLVVTVYRAQAQAVDTKEPNDGSIYERPKNDQ